MGIEGFGKVWGLSEGHPAYRCAAPHVGRKDKIDRLGMGVTMVVGILLEVSGFDMDRGT